MALKLRNGVFIHVPKAGGTWATSLLTKLGLVVETLPPRTHAGMPEILEKRPELKGAKAFCFVRHPFGWYQSFWAYRVMQGWDMNNPLDAECRASTFAEFIRNVVERRPGHLSARLKELTAGVTHIGRFEALRESTVMALTALGEQFDHAAVYSHPQENVSSKVPGHGLDLRYPPELLERLYAAEEWAFRTFGYGIMGRNGA